MSIKSEQIYLDRSGRKMPVYVSGPANDEVLPGLILIHEIYGLTNHIEDVANRFAQSKMRVYAPDLFTGAEGLPSDPSARNDLNLMRKIWSSIPDSQFISDLRAVLIAMQANALVDSKNIGTIGYCMGGAIALMFACESPELTWVADYYGRIKYQSLPKTKPKHPLDYVETLHCPLLGLFSGKDDLIPQKDIDRLEKQLEKFGKSYQIKVYPNASHAFFNNQRPNYNAEAAQDAWQLTLAFANSKTSKVHPPKR